MISGKIMIKSAILNIADIDVMAQTRTDVAESSQVTEDVYTLNDIIEDVYTL
jgi:hypothetical protein